MATTYRGFNCYGYYRCISPMGYNVHVIVACIYVGLDLQTVEH